MVTVAIEPVGRLTLDHKTENVCRQTNYNPGEIILLYGALPYLKQSPRRSIFPGPPIHIFNDGACNRLSLRFKLELSKPYAPFLQYELVSFNQQGAISGIERQGLNQDSPEKLASHENLSLFAALTGSIGEMIRSLQAKEGHFVYSGGDHCAIAIMEIPIAADWTGGTCACALNYFACLLRKRLLSLL